MTILLVLKIVLNAGLHFIFLGVLPRDRTDITDIVELGELVSNRERYGDILMALTPPCKLLGILFIEEELANIIFCRGRWQIERGRIIENEMNIREQIIQSQNVLSRSTTNIENSTLVMRTEFQEKLQLGKEEFSLSPMNHGFIVILASSVGLSLPVFANNSVCLHVQLVQLCTFCHIGYILLQK